MQQRDIHTPHNTSSSDATFRSELPSTRYTSGLIAALRKGIVREAAHSFLSPPITDAKKVATLQPIGINNAFLWLVTWAWCQRGCKLGLSQLFLSRCSYISLQQLTCHCNCPCVTLQAPNPSLSSGAFSFNHDVFCHTYAHTGSCCGFKCPQLWFGRRSSCQCNG